MAEEMRTGGGADLSGLRVLVTRPLAQSEPLCREIERLGGQAVALPALEIVAIERPDWRSVDAALSGKPDWIIPISANAARYGQAAFIERLGGWPERPRVVAIGRATAACLTESGVRVDIFPEAGGDSEALLARPELKGIKGQRILIIRGQGGREHLAEGLRARGAIVAYLEVYVRRCPVDCERRLAALAAEKAVDVVTVTSGEALTNLVKAGRDGGCLPWLSSLPLVAISPRIAASAREIGFQALVMVAEEMSDRGFILTLKGCYSKKP